MSERPMQKSIDVLCHAIKVAGEAALRLKAENDALQERVARAEQLCEIYFNIARLFCSENEIRQHRDAAIDASLSAKEGGGKANE